MPYLKESEERRHDPPCTTGPVLGSSSKGKSPGGMFPVWWGSFLLHDLHGDMRLLFVKTIGGHLEFLHEHLGVLRWLYGGHLARHLLLAPAQPWSTL